MLDLIIENGEIVDGSGAEPFKGDVAIKNGLITEVGDVSCTAKNIIEATDLTVIPGFVDIHTHYDGQVTWTEELTPSSKHGVTTAVMGNWGGRVCSLPTGRQGKIDIADGRRRGYSSSSSVTGAALELGNIPRVSR